MPHHIINGGAFFERIIIFMSILSCDNISLKLGGRDILKNVSFKAENAEVLGLVGPNGAGKTFYLKFFVAITHLIRDQLFLDGQSLNSKSFHERVKLGLARTYQSPVVPDSLSLEDIFWQLEKHINLIFLDTQLSGPPQW